MAWHNCITRRSGLTKWLAFALLIAPAGAFGGAIDDFQTNFASYLSQVASGSIAEEDLGKSLVLEVAVALKRGASGEEIGSVFVASAPGNGPGVNMQLGAVLGAVGAMVEAGAVEGENASAEDFHRASCDFAKSANLSQVIIDIECSK